MMRSVNGFTLVEVLIASTILFAALTVISESYRASLLASERAAKTAQILTPLPLIIGHVQGRLRETPDDRVAGRGNALGVAFEFEARSTRFEAPPRRFDPDAGIVMTYKPRFRLYDVRLTLKLGTLERRFDYQEIAWSPVAV